MAAVSPMSMLAEEIRLQVAGAITWNASKLQIAEHPSERALLSHDIEYIEFGEIERELADNESDFVRYRFSMLLATMSPSAETSGRTLEDWTRTASKTLGDRASDKSPLRNTPLTLSQLTLSGSVVFAIEIGTSTPGTMPTEGEQFYRSARTLEIIVTCYETRT